MDRNKNRKDSLRGHAPVRPGYWFAPKRYGLGSTPVTWQGWAVTLAFVLSVAAIMRFIPDTDLRLAVGVPLFLGFLWLCWTRTDGGWHWHWGSRRG